MTKILSGKVISTKMKNTIVVLVERKLKHPMYKKIINRRKKYKVHDESGNTAEGDMVQIKETKPLSKDKHFILVIKSDKKNLKVRASDEADLSKK